MDKYDNFSSHGSGRRRELVEIAYRHIAERGFEGLRVREVALEAGINNATLHYYFPTKEALIQGVVGYLLQEFTTSRVPRPNDGTETPQAELRREFEDLRHRLHETPQMGIVLTELKVRSLRDPAIAQMLAALDNGWRGYLVSIIERGIGAGVFRPDLDPTITATALIAQLKGIGFQTMGSQDTALINQLIAQLTDQVERWLAR